MTRRRTFQASTLTLTLGLLVGLGIIATGTAVEISSRPKFCGSCHIMTPYYESWKESSHSNVACVECHIPPGVTAEFRKKYEALSMVTSYFTGTYGTNPWAEIEDAACLRCHERRLLSGRELFGDVLFDHTAHLAGLRRGKNLRCTSCHSQIVQGSHIAVTASTCILCHFKGQEADSGTARCTLCHHIPDKTIQHANLTFNHADVGRYGMQCTWCHSRPEGSDGAVPRERCVTCHNEQSHLERFEETDFLHEMHVSEHKVDCMNCHLEIDHVGEPRIEQASAACSTCHEKGHSPQMNLYAGIGGVGVEPMPDPMFLAGVRCEGCHLEIPGVHAETRGASDVSCMSCHGPSYRGIYLSWKDWLARRSKALEDQIARTSSAIETGSSSLLADARFNLDLVSRGQGIHNVRYAGALLDRAHQDMNSARSERGLQSLPLPWKAVPYDSPCLSCHMGAETQSGRVFDRRFAHEPHVMTAGLDCETCHRPHEARNKGEVIRFGAAGCESCHHKDAGDDCASCHEGIRGRTFPSDLGDFSHDQHIDGAGLSCPDCHKPQPDGAVRLDTDACAGCHG